MDPIPLENCKVVRAGSGMGLVYKKNALVCAADIPPQIGRDALVKLKTGKPIVCRWMGDDGEHVILRGFDGVTPVDTVVSRKQIAWANKVVAATLP